MALEERQGKGRDRVGCLNFNINEKIGRKAPSNLSNSVFLAVCLPWLKLFVSLGSMSMQQQQQQLETHHRTTFQGFITLNSPFVFEDPYIHIYFYCCLRLPLLYHGIFQHCFNFHLLILSQHKRSFTNTKKPWSTFLLFFIHSKFPTYILVNVKCVHLSKPSCVGYLLIPFIDAKYIYP